MGWYGWDQLVVLYMTCLLSLIYYSWKVSLLDSYDWNTEWIYSCYTIRLYVNIINNLLTVTQSVKYLVSNKCTVNSPATHNKEQHIFQVWFVLQANALHCQTKQSVQLDFVSLKQKTYHIALLHLFSWIYQEFCPSRISSLEHTLL